MNLKPPAPQVVPTIPHEHTHEIHQEGASRTGNTERRERPESTIRALGCDSTQRQPHAWTSLGCVPTPSFWSCIQLDKEQCHSALRGPRMRMAPPLNPHLTAADAGPPCLDYANNLGQDKGEGVGRAAVCRDLQLSLEVIGK